MQGKLENLIGQKFGRLLVIERAESIKRKNGATRTQWVCQCDCGNIKIIKSESLKSNKTISCGCYHKEVVTGKQNKNFKHGKRNTRQYDIYANMKSRCYNVKNKRYKNYGGRGIKVCDEWLDKEKGFINFYNWAMKNGYQDNLTIDRINVNGNYEPNNCRWATKEEQQNNTTRNHFVLYKGKRYTMAQMSRILNISYDKLKLDLRKGRLKTICQDLQEN